MLLDRSVVVNGLYSPVESWTRSAEGAQHDVTRSFYSETELYGWSKSIVAVAVSDE